MEAKNDLSPGTPSGRQPDPVFNVKALPREETYIGLFEHRGASALFSEINHDHAILDSMKNINGTVAEAPKMYATENDIPVERRLELLGLLNRRLASGVDLQTQMKQAHWNVKGPNFIALHKLFDEVDEAVESYVDLIAERVVQLGGIAEGTARVAASRSQLKEYPLAIAGGAVHVEAVACALSTFGCEVRASINQAADLDDADTADLLTEVSRGMDKWLWFVEAHSQAPK